MKNTNELAILLKKIVHCENYIEYIPIEVIEGTYNEMESLFYDKNGTPYQSVINSVGSHGFFNRQSIEEYKKKYPNLPLTLIKKLQLHYAKKAFFTLSYEKNGDENVPILLVAPKSYYQKPHLSLDNDIIKIYEKNYPNMVKKLQENFNIDIKYYPTNTTKEEDNFNISKMYYTLTEKIINQEEPIKQILVAIWKQYNDFSDNKSRNILINGSTGVGKTQIFRELTKLLKIPHYITSATDYSATGYVGKSAEDMLINILKNANYDLEKAQKGILIIDEIDKLSESNNKNSQINQRDVQEAILKILEDTTIPITVNNKEYLFDTSKLMVIGLGSWSRISIEDYKIIGYEREIKAKEKNKINKETMINNGMIAELLGRFPIVVNMNNLEYEHLLKILKSKHGILELNKLFLQNKGIELIVDENTKIEIAKKAAKEKFGARSLDEIIETALSVASFEIASNPNTYSKLIISEETINDASNYKLIKRKED